MGKTFEMESQEKNDTARKSGKGMVRGCTWKPLSGAARRPNAATVSGRNAGKSCIL